MAVIRVQHVTVFVIDTDKYIDAAIEADVVTEGDVHRMRADTQELVEVATGYCDPVDLLPRWSRECVRVESHTIEQL